LTRIKGRINKDSNAQRNRSTKERTLDRYSFSVQNFIDTEQLVVIVTAALRLLFLDK
jgi:hypothetical protein